jgi:hypothetical protein
MATHHLENHGLGQRKVGELERSDDDVRFLDQAQVFGHQEIVLDERAARLARRGREPLFHHGGALVRVDDDVSRAEAVDVIGGASELDRAGRQESMSPRRSPARDVREFELDQPVAEDRDEPLDRPAERRVPRGPAHRFAKRDLLNDLRQRERQEIERCLADLAARSGEVLPLRRFDGAKIGDVAAELAGERLGCARRFALAIESRADGRSGELLRQIRLSVG